MARGRRTQTSGSSRSGPSSARRPATSSDVPDVYMSMVNEAMGVGSSSGAGASAGESSRTPKRRKVARNWRRNVREEEERLEREEEEKRIKSLPVVVEPPTPVVPEKAPDEPEAEEEEEDEDESDADWEDVDIAKTMASKAAVAPSGGDINFELNDAESSKKKQVRRITAVDRKIRLEVHKLHLLCLLSHLESRNNWCNDSTVQASMAKLMPPRVNESLHPALNLSQQERSRTFINGLTRAAAIWKNKFTVTGHGLYLPRWRESGDAVLAKMLDERAHDKLTLEHFQAAAQSMEGSPDIGAQLFCAFLRSANILTRLVFSLQPLPLGFSSKPEDVKEGEWKPPEQNFPVYWVEAWNIASQKWIPVDTVITHTVNQASKLEPPNSDLHNSLSYVVAIEPDGCARDVTRRYAKAYNAKTRKLRVSNTKGGDKWWRKALRHFERDEEKDRDQLEDAEFSRIELEEGIPKSVADMKDHPLFALERHLKRYEILHPKRKVASITTGVGAAKVTENVYRRKDVQHVRSPEQWYRLGRIVRPGEEPMKIVSARKKPPTTKRRDRRDDDDEIDLSEMPEGPSEVALFGEWQTDVYEPPPVFEGMVPKNMYGNLDVFVPTMVPAGGTHIPHEYASKACKILQVDFADAVVSFNFHPRQPVTPVLSGVVVASEFLDAVWEVIEGLKLQEEERKQAEKSLEALALWKRFLMKLEIKERAGAYFDEEVRKMEKEALEKELEEEKERERREEKVDAPGGFIPDDREDVIPRKSLFKKAAPSEFVFAGGFIPSDDEDQEGIEASNGAQSKSQQPSSSANAFIPTGGGFLPSDDEEEPAHTNNNIQARAQNSTTPFIPTGGGFIPSDDEGEEPRHPNEGIQRGPKESTAPFIPSGGGFLPSADECDTEEKSTNGRMAGAYLPDTPSPDGGKEEPVVMSEKARGKQKAVQKAVESEEEGGMEGVEEEDVDIEEEDMDYDWF